MTDALSAESPVKCLGSRSRSPMATISLGRKCDHRSVPSIHRIGRAQRRDSGLNFVGLLSAAAIHGASHQQPQEFQVVVPEPMRAIRAGRVTIRFYTKAALRSSSVVEVKTSTGYMRVSDPAATAIDLVAYADRVGGLDRVLTVLQELSEKITPDMLLDAAKKEKQLAFAQRLGWLLEEAGHSGLVEQLSDWMTKRKPRETPLDPSLPRKGFPRDPRWKVIVNADVEGTSDPSRPHHRVALIGSVGVGCSGGTGLDDLPGAGLSVFAQAAE